MAKELPYWKFTINDWDNGNIQMCSHLSKGLFIDICSMYWARLGELPFKLALQKICNGNASALDELIQEEIILVNDGNIIVEFLDEQLNEFQKTSIKRAKAANKRWKNASALQNSSNSNAIREEEIREEESKEEESKEETILMSEANASNVTKKNVKYFEIGKAFYDLLEWNSGLLDVEWVHLKKISAKKFLDDIRLMFESDGRTMEDARLVWKFLQHDEFWMKNIQSAKKLREKFDQLITKSKNPHQNGKGKQAGSTDFQNMLRNTPSTIAR